MPHLTLRLQKDYTRLIQFLAQVQTDTYILMTFYMSKNIQFMNADTHEKTKLYIKYCTGGIQQYIFKQGTELIL